MSTLLNTLVRTAGGDVYDNNNAGSDGIYSAQYVQQRKYYEMVLIKRLLPYLPLWEDAQKKTIPARSGGFGSNGVIELRKFHSLDVDTTALTEGTAPDGLNVDMSKVTVSLAQYGDWIPMSDILVDASIDDIMGEYMDILAENAGRKLHKVIINALTGGDVTQTEYGGSATAANQLTASDVLTSSVIKRAVRTLRTNNVMPFSDGFYHAVIHPYQAHDLQNDSLWQDVSKYNGGTANGGGLNLITGEIGKMHGVKFRESTEVLTDTAGASSAATYHGLLYGPNSWGLFDLKTQATSNINTETGKGMSIFVHPVNTPTPTDPLGQQGFISWKASFAAKLIDPLRLVRLRTGATQ